jgi:Mg-chelatase subunit ChlD
MDFLSKIEAFNDHLRGVRSHSRSGFTQTGCYPAVNNENDDIAVRIIIIDRSGSMIYDDYPPSRLQAAKEASIEYIKVLSGKKAKTDIAVISFGNDSKLVLPPTGINNLQDIINGISLIDINGTTNIAAGLKKAKELLAKYPAKKQKQIILLTDGYGNCPLKIPENIKRYYNTVIDVVGIGGSHKDVDEKLLRKIATTDSEGICHYRFIKDTQKLRQHYRQLADGIVWKGNSK